MVFRPACAHGRLSPHAGACLVESAASGFARTGVPGYARVMTDQGSLLARFGGIDIYLFDQLLKGRILPAHRLLDAGCGRGRNLAWFVDAGHDVHAVDADEASVEAVRARYPSLGPERVQVAPVEDLPFPGDAFDVVVCNAVVHFARDHAHADAMVAELLRVLSPGGMLFVRLASDIGIESRVERLGGGRAKLPDGSTRYLVDEARLLAWTEGAGGVLLDPIKTTNVQGLRCMTTWALRV